MPAVTSTSPGQPSLWELSEVRPHSRVHHNNLCNTGGLHLGIHHLMLRFRLDDPLDAVAVHGGGGLVGLLSVPWFMYVKLEEGQRWI